MEFKINKEDVFKALNSRLLSQKEFESFKWLKSKSELVDKDKTSKITRTIGFELYETVFDADSYDLGYELTVFLSIRFEILFKWFEKFYLGDLRDFRARPTFLRIFNMNDSYKIFFYRDGLNFDDNVEKAVKHISENSLTLFNSYTSLEQVYHSEIVPILENKYKPNLLPIPNWFTTFEYLATCKIIEPENFDKLDAIFYDYMKYRKEYKDPNVIKYFPIYREAVDELKKIKL